MSKEKQCECCHEWWYASEIKNDLCLNCYDYFKQLKLQLEEKDKQINNLEQMCQICNKEQENEKLKQQLEEKDKEIERLKQELEETNAEYDFTYEQRTETIKELKQNQTQLAIQELEKVKILLQNAVNCDGYTFVGIYDAVNNQIKELKGE